MRDDEIIALPDRIARGVRTRLGMYDHGRDVLVPFEEMLTALGDSLPLATLSRVIRRDRPDGMIALHSDGRLDPAPASGLS